MTDRSFDQAVSSVAERQHGAFTLGQAARCGGTKRRARCRLDSGRWLREGQRLFRLRDWPVSWHQRLWLAHLAAGPESAVSHRAAAQLLGFKGYKANAVEVIRYQGLDHELQVGRLHQTSLLPPEHLARIDGLPCTSVARSIFDLAGDPEPHLRTERGRLIHAARMRRLLSNALVHHGLTIEKQAAVLVALGRRGRPGTALMRELIAGFADHEPPTESGLEDMFLALIAAHGLPSPCRQVEVGDDEGFIGRVDFLYREARLIIEIDGDPWHDAPLERAADLERDKRLRAAGWTVIRRRWRDLVERPGEIAGTIRSRLT